MAQECKRNGWSVLKQTCCKLPFLSHMSPHVTTCHLYLLHLDVRLRHNLGMATEHHPYISYACSSRPIPRTLSHFATISYCHTRSTYRDGVAWLEAWRHDMRRRQLKSVGISKSSTPGDWNHKAVESENSSERSKTCMYIVYIHVYMYICVCAYT